jgi:hypothetical protein
MGKVSQPTICIAGHRYYTEKQGGVELQTRYIGDILAGAGWKVAFLSPSLNKKKGREEINENISVWWYPHFSFNFQVPRDLLEGMLEDISPYVFYQRGRGQLTGNNFILQYARKKSIPYVFAFSSDPDLDMHYELKSTIRSYKPLWKKIVLIPYAMLLDNAMSNILKKADYIVVQHEEQADLVKKKLHKTANMLRTVHHELKREVNKSEQKIVLWVNNYRPLKQGEVFVDLALAL